ncbi:MAG: hypothetical protein LBB73_07965 [Dysgonamonadaceae bacterium]|nr:hypothetical protein [Dysgonamonadaceae bacterium]
MSLFRHALINSTRRPFPKTMRYKLFAVAGYITQTADRKTLHLAKGLRNREAFPGIRRSLDDFLLPYVYP